jgi:hypothetical protein
VWLVVGPEPIIFSRLQQFRTVQEVLVDVSCREDKVVVGRVASLLGCCGIAETIMCRTVRKM